MITAADDLSTGLLQAVIGLETAYTTCVEHALLYPPDPNLLTFRDPGTGEMAAESSEALQLSRELIREVKARHARISLLFGPASAPDRSTRMAVLELDEAQRALEDRPTPDFDRYSSALAEARVRHRKFNEYALQEVRGRPWFARWRVARWARRQFRRLGEALRFR